MITLNSNLILKIVLFALLIYCFGCQQTGSAPRLQQHLAAAKTSSAQTGQGIKSAQGHLETSDYKSTKIRGLLKQGVEQ